MARISSQIRLAEHAALACVRDCVADLEKTSESISAAGLFQVRQQESKAGEQGMYRKSGECAGLRKAAGQHQAARPVFAQKVALAALSSLVAMPYLVRSPALARHPSAHLLIIRRAAQDCCGKARRCALLSQAARQSCPFTRTSDCRAGGTLAKRGAPRQAEPRRASLACAAAERHGPALG